jgi:hypothetical protein
MKKVLIAASVLAGFAFVLIGVYRGAFLTNIVVLPEYISPGVIVRQDGLVGPHAELEKAGRRSATRRVRCGT